MPAYITWVWRYPVKSMLGEELEESLISKIGLSGDRAHALVDTETGKVASAKNPRKWGLLFQCRATGESPASVSLPDGSTVRTDQAGLEPLLSSLFGRDVKLQTVAPDNPSLEEYWPDIEGLAYRETVTDEGIGAGAPAGTFFDYAPVHLLTTATLRRLRHFYPDGEFAVQRFRPNLLIDSEEDGFVENAWVGRTLRIGADLRLKSDRSLSALRYDNPGARGVAERSRHTADGGPAQSCNGAECRAGATECRRVRGDLARRCRTARRYGND
jgi:uncharacterized protein YcbX